MVNKRRQTLATGRMPPTAAAPSDGSTRSQKLPLPKSRKSMIPRVAGTENEVNRPPPSSRLPRKSRMSMGSSSAPPRSATPSKNRRVSLAATGPTGEYVQDPRQLKDKQYLLAAIKKMVAYLKKHGYDTTNLQTSKLVNGGLSGRDFNHIMTFLLRRLDPGFNSAGAGSGRSDEPPLKFEEEVSLAFRTLGYPFPISKTGIVAVGSPHTWPALVAAIDWLLDVLSVVEVEAAHDWTDDLDTEEELYNVDSNADRATRQFDAFLRKSMPAWLRDERELCEELEAELLHVWEGDTKTTEAFLDGVEGDCKGLGVQIETMERENQGLSGANQKREQLASDIEKYLSLVSDLKELQSELQAKVSSLTEEKSTMEASMDDLSTNIDRLKQIIGSQELTVDDVRRLERQKLRLEEQCVQKKSVLKGHSNALKETEEKYATCMQMLNAAVEDYTANAKRLEFIPKTANNACGKSLEIRLNETRGAESLEGLLGVDMDSVIVSHVRKISDGYEKKTNEEKHRVRELKGRMKELDAESAELDQEIETIQYKIATRQEQSTIEQEKLHSEIQSKQRQLQLLQAKINTLNDPSGTESTIAKYDEQYKELQATRKKQHDTIVAKKKAVAEEIRTAVEAVAVHETFVQRAIHEKNEYIETKKRELKLMMPRMKDS